MSQAFSNTPIPATAQAEPNNPVYEYAKKLTSVHHNAELMGFIKNGYMNLPFLFDNKDTFAEVLNPSTLDQLEDLLMDGIQLFYPDIHDGEFQAENAEALKNFGFPGERTPLTELDYPPLGDMYVIQLMNCKLVIG